MTENRGTCCQMQIMSAILARIDASALWLLLVVNIWYILYGQFPEKNSITYQ